MLARGTVAFITVALPLASVEPEVQDGGGSGLAIGISVVVLLALGVVLWIAVASVTGVTPGLVTSIAEAGGVVVAGGIAGGALVVGAIGFFFGRIVTIGLSLFIYYQARFGSRPTRLIPPPIPHLSPRLPSHISHPAFPTPAGGGEPQPGPDRQRDQGFGDDGTAAVQCDAREGGGAAAGGARGEGARVGRAGAARD